MIQNVNQKFDNPPNRIENASEQLPPKSVARFHEEYENKPVPTAWNVAKKM